MAKDSRPRKPPPPAPLSPFYCFEPLTSAAEERILIKPAAVVTAPATAKQVVN